MPGKIVIQILSEGMEARNARRLEKPPHVEALHLAINAFLEHVEHEDAVNAGAYEAFQEGVAHGGEQAKQAFLAALTESDHPPHSRLPVLSQFLLNEWNFVRRPVPEPPAHHFVNSLHRVADGMLAREDAACGICLQPYGTGASGEEDDKSYAVQLPCCSQPIGHDCIKKVSDLSKTCYSPSVCMDHDHQMKVDSGVHSRPSRATLTSPKHSGWIHSTNPQGKTALFAEQSAFSRDLLQTT